MTFTLHYINYSILYVGLVSSKNVDIDAVETWIVLFFKIGARCAFS